MKSFDECPFSLSVCVLKYHPMFRGLKWCKHQPFCWSLPGDIHHFIANPDPENRLIFDQNPQEVRAFLLRNFDSFSLNWWWKRARRNPAAKLCSWKLVEKTWIGMLVSRGTKGLAERLIIYIYNYKYILSNIYIYINPGIPRPQFLGSLRTTPKVQWATPKVQF